MEASISHRPYWHVDAKWIFGILLFISLGASLLLFNLNRLTEREPAVNLSATLVASLFSRDGLDDEASVAEFRQKVAASKTDKVAPLEQFPNVQISKQDAANLKARDLRLAIFKQITEPIYDDGLQGASAKFSTDPVQQQKFQNQAAFLSTFTKKTHQTLGRAFLVSALSSLVFCGLLIYFSAGWGRLVSPGLILIMASPAGALAALVLLGGQTGGNSTLATVVSSAKQQISAGLSQSYLAAFILGIGLLLAAAVGKMVTRKHN